MRNTLIKVKEIFEHIKDEAFISKGLFNCTILSDDLIFIALERRTDVYMIAILIHYLDENIICKTMHNEGFVIKLKNNDRRY